MKKKTQKSLIFTLVFLLFFQLVPYTNKGTFVYGQTTPKFTIRNVYQNFDPVEKSITIDDHRMRDLNDKKLSLWVGGQFQRVTNIQTFGSQIIQANINKNWTFTRALVEGTHKTNNTSEEIRYDNIDEGILIINSLEERTIGVEDPIVAIGTQNLSGIVGNPEYKIWVGGVEAQAQTIEGSTNTNKIKIVPKETAGGPKIQFAPGTQDITVVRTVTRGEYTLENIFLYRNAITIIGNLDLEGVRMFPTMGEPRSDVTFERSTFPIPDMPQQEADKLDIYFISDLNNPQLFREEFRAKNFRYAANRDLPKDAVITVEVPNIAPGAYHIVFTNGDSQRLGINRRYVLPNQQYRVITVSPKPVIESIQPQQASAQIQTDVTITGYLFSKMNIEDLTLQNPNQPPAINIEGGKIKLDYGQGILNLPAAQGGALSVKVTREIEVEMGQPLPVIDFTIGEGQSDPNTFKVRTNVIQIPQATTVDVVIRLVTTLQPLNSEGQPDLTQNPITLATKVVRPNGFTYYPSTEAPLVTSVTPSVIPIEESGGDYYLTSSMGELLISISGNNFLVTRYTQGGQEKINYPKVEIGGVIIDPNLEGPYGMRENNQYKPMSFEVMQGNQVIDGTSGKEIGDRIIIKLKAGTGEGSFKVVNPVSRLVGINNPMRKSSDFSNTIFRFDDMIRFQVIDENDFPVIDSVQPSLVAMEGGVQVVITGSNLRTGAQVFIDNRLVPNVQISGDNRRITFMAPAGSRPGTTQLQVINPNNGGIATYPFTYTTTYTQPILTLINPREGTNDTLVNVKGGNFLNSDPTVTVSDITNISEFLMYRLIGTRILMDGHDINRYNRNSNNQIQLTSFIDGIEGRNLKDPVFVYENNEIQLGDSFDSVLLYDGSRFYIITRNLQNQYAIEDGLGGRYTITYQDGNFRAIRGNNVYQLELDNPRGEIKMKQGSNLYKTLEAYTPYHIEKIGGYDRITGKRVEFVDSNTLLFRVPVLRNAPWSGPGDYDVTVVNPDTKSVTLQKAFRYYSEPQVTPLVEDIIPYEGPSMGGNKILIISPDDNNPNTGFMDTGTTKTKVFIGSQQVPPQNITISPNRREISLIVPPYYEDIKTKGTDRITVPVVLVNPDGGTFHVSHSQPITVERVEKDGTSRQKIVRGYTYVIPASNPRIDQIIPKEGAADGGYIVEIFGFDFRNYRNIFDQQGNIVDRIEADQDKRTSLYNPQYSVFTSDLYPKVYFGNREAEIVEFAYGYLQVVIPPGEGTVDVYLINNDAGISNKVKFTYRKSQPAITSVTPSQGDRRGKDKVEILGRDFLESTITLLKEDYDQDGKSLRDTLKMAMVKVGDRNNLTVPRDNPLLGGLIRSSRATVTLTGGLRVHYNGDGNSQTLNQPFLEVSIEDRGKIYSHTYVGDLQGQPLYINTTTLKNSEGEGYTYEELIKIQIIDNRLLVDAGYAPHVVYRSNQQLLVTMPSYFTIGTVPLRVVNPDGGTATSNFHYRNPDSRPSITNITREGGREAALEVREGFGEIRVLQVNHKGGNIVTIWGNDFRENAIIQISNLATISPQNIDYQLPNRLTFTMPPVAEAQVGSLHRIVVLNTDGGSASSDKAQPPIYLEFIKGESSPTLQNLSPDRGPATGGTRVKITGNDFRKTMEGFEGEVLRVFFGEAAVVYQEGKEDLVIEDYKTLYVTAPPSTRLGQVDVRVENPDGSLATPPLKYTYISKPKINKVEPPQIFTNDTEREVTLTGEMFMTGAKVVLGGTIKKEEEVKPQDNVLLRGISGVENGKNLEVAVVGGVLASSVTVVDANTILVKFNESLGLENSHLIVVNPDGGVSEPYKDFNYQIPIPHKPLVLEGIPGYESTVKLLWSDSAPEVLNRADRYEIYGKKSTDRNYSFIGETKEAEFLVRGLEANTRYDFMVRALNRYGSALEFAEVSVRTLTLREDEKLKEKLEELEKEADKLKRQGKEEVLDGALVKTIGTEEIPRGTSAYRIDFSLNQYKDHDKFIVALPVSILTTLNRNITVTDGKASFTFNPRNLYTREAIQSSRDNPQDAYVRVIFERLTASGAEELYTAVPRNQRRASNIYSIDFEVQVERNITPIRQILNPGSLTISFDSRAYPNVDEGKIFIGKYEPSRHEFIRQRSGSFTQLQEKGQFMLLADR